MLLTPACCDGAAVEGIEMGDEDSCREEGVSSCASGWYLSTDASNGSADDMLSVTFS